MSAPFFHRYFLSSATEQIITFPARTQYWEVRCLSGSSAGVNVSVASSTSSSDINVVSVPLSGTQTFGSYTALKNLYLRRIDGSGVADVLVTAELVPTAGPISNRLTGSGITS